MTEREIKRRFRNVLIGYCILAVTVVLGIWYNHHQQDQLDRHQHAIVIELKGIKSNQEAIQRLTVNTAVAICLEAFTNSRHERIALIKVFNDKGIITTHNSTCTTAATKAELLVFPTSP